MTKVLNLVQDLSGGGTQRVAANYARKYFALGFDSAVLGMMQLLLAGAGIAAWLGVTARAHQRDAQRDEPLVVQAATLGRSA